MLHPGCSHEAGGYAHFTALFVPPSLSIFCAPLDKGRLYFFGLYNIYLDYNLVQNIYHAEF
jgi:hypothetical protein